jgi:hypothetical protein
MGEGRGEGDWLLLLDAASTHMDAPHLIAFAKDLRSNSNEWEVSAVQNLLSRGPFPHFIAT